MILKWRRKMIPPVKKILYATDLTKNSAYAGYYALDLAQKHEAEVVILHCTDPIPDVPVYSQAGRYGIDAPKARKNDEKRRPDAEIRKRLGDLYRKVGDKINPKRINFVSTIIVRPGYPIEEILNTADAEHCDLIVLGTHGKGWLKQTFLGSTARSVLERTRKPVFIVPLPPEQIDIDWE
jgi:nucleotide-binding universal stress UspA family protein